MAGLAETNRQRQRSHEVLMQLPACVAAYHGPDHIYQSVNPPYQGLFLHRSFLGRPFREGTPEANTLGVVALFGQVYQTGEPYYASEMEGWFDFCGTSEPEQVFLNLSLHPLRNAQGCIDGILDFSCNVTGQVQHFDQMLALAQAATERERILLQAMFTQALVAIALFQGADVRVVSVNERMAALWGRTPGQVLGQPLVAGVPELRAQGFDDMMRQVLATGVPYVGTEAPATILQDGKLVSRYYNFICQPTYDAQGTQLGVFNVGTEVTESRSRPATASSSCTRRRRPPAPKAKRSACTKC